jgi:hypothetical protein
MWRWHLALVHLRRQDAGETQGWDGLATISNSLGSFAAAGKISDLFGRKLIDAYRH